MKDNGNQAKVAVYSKKDFPILSVAFTKFMAGQLFYTEEVFVV